MLDDSPEISGAECRAFFDHWRSLIDAGLMPHSRTYLNNAEPSLITMVHIAEVTAWGQRIRFMGTGLVDLLGEDRTNKILGSDLPPKLKKQFDDRAAAVVKHPCGLSEVAAFKRSTGRTFNMETVILPLAVDENRAPRYCCYSAILEPPDNRDERPSVQYTGTAHSNWVDIGNGVPAVDPNALISP